MNKRVLITGITGQDGSYLAEYLLERGNIVFGFARRESWYRPNSASHLRDRIAPLFGDMSEGVDIASAIQESQPDEIYNLASQSRPGESWARPFETMQVNGAGAVRLFEAVRHNRPRCRVYHASSSEMFGQGLDGLRCETSPLNPVNPYAAAKTYAHHMAGIYRDSYRLFISTGILFNHESDRRPLDFLTQKVAHGAACASLRISTSPDLNERGHPIVENGKLALGNMDIARDWGFAQDFVRAMWLMLQQDEADNFVIGTGKLHTLQSLCETAYGSVDKDWRECVISDPALVRPLETTSASADATKARARLGWTPSVTFEQMIRQMVQAQISRLDNAGANRR